jgi:ATP-dependent protease HslVU (ClpYQ) peptidase subunit
VIGIGSGGAFAECKILLKICLFLVFYFILFLFFSGAARALIDVEGLTAKDIALKSMKIAADKCVYTNHNWICETLNWLPSEI